MEKHHPELVVSNMKKDLRHGKVLIDWSQNSRHKTTVCAYSLRARPHPTVSTPVTLGRGGRPPPTARRCSFEADEVLDRIEDMGDLFADTATVGSTSRAASASADPPRAGAGAGWSRLSEPRSTWPWGGAG